MFYVKFENYCNDFTKYYEEKAFSDLESLKKYLIEENEKRDNTPKSSSYWSCPCGVNKSTGRAYFRTKRNGSGYALWLVQVKYNDIIVFEENYYTSPKFQQFILDLKEEISKKEEYGDF